MSEAAALVAAAAADDEEVVVFPASFAQRRLWLLEQLEPGNPAYVVPRALRLAGALRPAVLAATLAEIVRRHEVLRTELVAVDGEPVQVVSDAVALPLPLADLAGLPRVARETEGRRLAAREVARPFDLARPPLLRPLVLRLAPTDWLLVVTLHHLVSDAWSTRILVREVGALYEAFARGRPTPLPPLPLQYGDWAAWQRERLAGPVLAERLAWWRRALTGAPAALELPLDRPRRAAGGGSAGIVEALIPAAPLGALGARLRATPFMVFLAGFQALLARLSGQEDLTVGTPVAGRDRVEIEELIGCFINTLVMRGDLAGDPSFSQLVERTREAVLAVFAHQDLPFELLVAELRPERDLLRTPLFQVMFSPQPPPPEAALDDVEITGESLPPAGAKYDLTLFTTPLGAHPAKPGGAKAFAPLGDRHALHLHYRSDLFARTTAERLVRQLAALYTAAAAAPERRLSELELLSAAERQQLLVEWNDTAAGAGEPSPALFPERFAEAARRAPAAPALGGPEKEWSYREVEARSRRLAAALAARGVGAEARVALWMERSPEAVVAMLGVLRAGAAYAPLETAQPPARVAALLAGLGPRLVIASSPLRDRLPAGAAEVVTLEEIEREGARRAEGVAGAESGEHEAGEMAGVLPPPAPESAAYVLFTSGSTGEPKGVVVEHRQLAHYLDAVSRRLELPRGGRYAVATTLAADLGHTMVFPALAGGGCLYVPPAERAADPAVLVADLAAWGIDCVKLVPSQLAGFWESGGDRRVTVRGASGAGLAGSVTPDGAAPPAAGPKASELPLVARRLVLGGEALRWPAAERAAALAGGGRVDNHYGPTETTVGVATRRVGPPRQGESVPLGRPLPGVRLHVLDRRLQPVPIGVHGELCVGGPTVARGYLDRPGATAERFLPDPWAPEPGGRLYRTGDRVRRLPDGELEFLGRVDHQVKVRGHRVEPGEVEAALAAHPAVEAAAVVARADAVGDLRLLAYVVARRDAVPAGPGADRLAAALRAHLRERLPEPMVPAAITLLPALPLTAQGKLDRRALPEPGEAAAGAGGAPPRDAVERALVELWEEALGVRPVGVTDSFFDLGGHSISAVRLMARLRERFGCDLPLAELFRAPTVERLAARLREPGQIPSGPLVRLAEGPAGRGRPPLVLVHPAGGNVLCFAALARRLAAERPVWALQAPGLAPGGAPLDRVEALAERHLGALRAALPHGPYLLAGWSFGGLVAWEMACRLRAAGEEVALLALLDTRLPGDPHGGEGAEDDADEEPLLRGLFRELGVEAREETEEAGGAPGDPGASGDLLARLLAAAQAAGRLPPDLGLADARRHLAVYRAARRAGRLYRPPGYPGAVLLVRASGAAGAAGAGGAVVGEASGPAGWPATQPAGGAASGLLGWAALAAGGLEVVAVPCGHVELVAEPHAAAVAAAIEWSIPALCVI